MATRIPSDQLINPQMIEAVVSGPDGANRLFVFTGMAPVAASTMSGGQAKETFTWLLGPQLGRRQFIRGIASASIVDMLIRQDGPAANAWCALDLIEADWDDEAQQVECRVELRLSANNGFTQVAKVSYHVVVLAEIPA